VARIIDYPRGMEEPEDTAPHGVEEQEDAAPNGVEEQEDAAPDGVEGQGNTTRGIGIVLGMAGLLAVIVAVLSVSGHLDPMNGVWRPGQSETSFVITLDPVAIDAELARLRGLPGETLPANLGRIAQGKTACIVQLMVDKPGAKAMAAATRLFVVLSAARQRTESPLIDPRLYEFSAYDAQDTEGLLQLVESGVIPKFDMERLAKLVEDYSAASHPIYSGLGLDAGEWAYLDFKKIAAVAGTDAKRVNACDRARVGG
jgi:hypothetical protein